MIEFAVRTLGKQWAMRARLVEGHQLITVGPCAYIRNPIYTGMPGMLIATGLATKVRVKVPGAVPGSTVRASVIPTGLGLGVVGTF